MPTPETALIETLTTMRHATHAVLLAARSDSETARSAYASSADLAIKASSECIQTLAQTCADQPTLFGQRVGDGLDVERAQARVAVSILRKLLALGVEVDRDLGGTSGRPPTLEMAGASDRWCDITDEEAALLEALAKEAGG